MHFYRFTDWGSAYRDADEFFAELGKVYQQEIADLAKTGCRYVQLDEVAVAILCDPAAREKVKAGGEDPDRLVDLYIDAINQAVKNRPAGMTVGVHVCRGNYKGMYLSEGGYDSVAEKFFSRTNVDHFLLEFDTPRAGGFAPLRFVPKGKGVVLGLVSSKTPQLESMDVLKRRTDEASRYLDAESLAISPQCGFASTMGGNPVTEADERAKLKLCVDAAREDLAMKIYALNLFDIADREEYLAYSQALRAREVQAHGGRVVALGKFREAAAGDIEPRQVLILVEWDSKEAFDSYCNDPKLADLHPHRDQRQHAATSGTCSIASTTCGPLLK